MSLFPDQARFQPRNPAPKFEELSQPWTTARCHRLLRPLVSRITSLRKEVSVIGQTKTFVPKLNSASVSVSSASNSEHYDQPNTQVDCLVPRKKRPRLTYSQRRGTKPSQSLNVESAQNQLEQTPRDESRGVGEKRGVKKAFKCVRPQPQPKSIAPGEIVASTPMLRRARGKIELSPVAPLPELDLSSNQTRPDRKHRTKSGSSFLNRLEARLAGLRDSQPSRYADLEAIYRSLEALLKATTTRTVKNSLATGPRSFLEMCLRRVPQYIIELDAWERYDAEESGTVSTLDDIDTSAHIYNELETLGTNVGWRHLRVVVRADGLNAVKTGIQEGVFSDEFSQLVIDLCVQLGAVSEAEDLTAALINCQYPEPLSTGSCYTHATALQPLLYLNSFAIRTQRTSFLFRQYSVLLSSGHLPVDWLATTEFERVWALAVCRLASTQPSVDAVNFATQCIVLLCNQRRTYNNDSNTLRLEQDMMKASQRTLMSTLGIISSLALLGETELRTVQLTESETRRIAIIGDKLRYILRASINELSGHTRGRGNPRLGVLYLALFLSLEQSRQEKSPSRTEDGMGNLSPASLTSLLSKDIRIRKHYDSVTWLIASIARACGRGTAVASHQCLNGLFERMKVLELRQDQLNKLKAAAAFLVAQQTNNVRDLIYAESLHRPDRSSSGATSQQQSGGTLFTGYRWEETIGEWVTASPVARKRRAPTMTRQTRQTSPASDTGVLQICRPNNKVSSVADSVSDTEACLNQGIVDDEQPNTDESTRSTYDEQGLLFKKRPRRFRSTEALTTTLVKNVLAPLKTPRHSLSSKFQEIQAEDSDKENFPRMLAKKPRRSSRKIMLGMRSLPRHSIGRPEDLSDDELCV
ncbi:hypothetical protein F4808DRAFT_80830 [Astrocystis sublimbata]|nr:hypothetical protein F4808DRAFT_80830 [Astrocystis sublimbata]